jgi:hypothetical protein
MKDSFSVEFTREELEEISTQFNSLAARCQNDASNSKATKGIDEAFRFFNGIAKKAGNAFGMQWHVTSNHGKALQKSEDAALKPEQIYVLFDQDGRRVLTVGDAFETPSEFIEHHDEYGFDAGKAVIFASTGGLIEMNRNADGTFTRPNGKTKFVLDRETMRVESLTK